MATLLSLVNTVLPEIGFPQLTTVVGNSNQTARLALALANREGRSLAKFNWRILVKRNVITTVSSADSYTLPSDFDRFIHNTEWNDTADTKMSGPISDPLWQADLSGIGYVSINDRFQLRADGNNARIFVRPIPTSAENLTFFYALKQVLPETTRETGEADLRQWRPSQRWPESDSCRPALSWRAPALS